MGTPQNTTHTPIAMLSKIQKNTDETKAAKKTEGLCLLTAAPGIVYSPLNRKNQCPKP